MLQSYVKQQLHRLPPEYPFALLMGSKISSRFFRPDFIDEQSLSRTVLARHPPSLNGIEWGLEEDGDCPLTLEFDGTDVVFSCGV